MISIIIPALNEASTIVKTLKSLQSMRKRGHEVILVDGGSLDDTVSLSRPFTDRIIQSPKGRSLQMNEGARVAKGDILLFLHADTIIPEDGDQWIIERMKKEKRFWGRFDVKLSGRDPIFRFIEFLMNLRSRLTKIATGDQAIFVKREFFEMIGGFPKIYLMEDIALCKILKNYGKPLCLYKRVITSSRRWKENGILRTILLMWFLRGAYFFKVNPNRLARIYYGSSEKVLN